MDHPTETKPNRDLLIWIKRLMRSASKVIEVINYVPRSTVLQRPETIRDV
jgi:hypothetical protein